MKILIAEDELSLAKAITAILKKNNYEAEAVHDGENALHYLSSEQYDAAILDVMMPQMDGVTVLKQYREGGGVTPILMLTAKSEVDDIVLGLDSGANDYLPHKYPENCVVYTGTHDNETIAGWFDSISDEERQAARDYLCDQLTPKEQLHKSFVSLAMRSVARTCIIPIQDYLGLDNSARINKPSTIGINWKWRLTEGQLTDELKEEILRITGRYGRTSKMKLKKEEKKAAEKAKAAAQAKAKEKEAAKA